MNYIITDFVSRYLMGLYLTLNFWIVELTCDHFYFIYFSELSDTSLHIMQGEHWDGDEIYLTEWMVLL